MTDPASVYRKLAEIPIHKSAYFLSDDNHSILLESSVRDHTSNIKRNYTQEILLGGLKNSSVDAGTFNVASTSPVESAESIIARVFSSKSQLIGILRETKESTKKRFVEIWRGQSREVILEVTSYHGSFHTDENFSSLCFSQDESSLLYTAEANPPSEIPGDPFHKFRFNPSFGEKCVDIRNPTLFLLHLSAEPILHSIEPTFEGEVPDSSLGQATFASTNGEKVVCTAYERTRDNRKLGIIYCTNRRSRIVSFSLPSLIDKENFKITVQCSTVYHDNPCRSPRVWFGPTNTVLVFICSLNEPHGSSSILRAVKMTQDGDFNPKDVRTIVSPILDPEAEEFPGLFIQQLPSNPFTISGGVVVSSIWRSRSVVLAIDIDKGLVTELTERDGNTLWSWNVHRTNGNSYVLASRSSPENPNELMLGIIGEASCKWRSLTTTSKEVQSLLAPLRSSIIKLKDRYPIETIVIQNDKLKEKTPPCVTIPHGGPHSTTTTSFNASGAAFALAGYTVSYPNYTGSLGFGQKYVTALLGHCGRLDIDDVLAITKEVISRGICKEGPQNHVISGGSHGGFITAHLVGQFPTFFSAAVLRNPVINMGTMIASTDIPDWTTVECAIPYSAEYTVDPTLYKTLYDASPIQYIDSVHTPVLLHIGDVDLRVPPSQGRAFYHGLKERQRTVEMLCFPSDSHPLDSVETERVVWESSYAWFEKYRLL